MGEIVNRIILALFFSLISSLAFAKEPIFSCEVTDQINGEFQEQVTPGLRWTLDLNQANSQGLSIGDIFIGEAGFLIEKDRFNKYGDIYQLQSMPTPSDREGFFRVNINDGSQDKNPTYDYSVIITKNILVLQQDEVWETTFFRSHCFVTEKK